MTRTKRNDVQFPLLKLYKYSYYIMSFLCSAYNSFEYCTYSECLVSFQLPKFEFAFGDYFLLNSIAVKVITFLFSLLDGGSKRKTKSK
jgi:hypothetical protein